MDLTNTVIFDLYYSIPILFRISLLRNDIVCPNHASESEVAIQANAIAVQCAGIWFSQGISLTELIPDKAILF